MIKFMVSIKAVKIGNTENFFEKKNLFFQKTKFFSKKIKYMKKIKGIIRCSF